MRRIFVAIDISDEARKKATAQIEIMQTRFSNVRVGWVRPDKLHLTLKFIGDMDEDGLRRLMEAAAKTAIQAASFNLTIAGSGVFPSKRKARTLWFGVVDPDERMKDLYQVLETECEKAGFTRETRDLKPHLTIARIREPQRSGDLVEGHLQTQFEPVGFKVRQIVIYESRLQPSGSAYIPVSRHRLID